VLLVFILPAINDFLTRRMRLTFEKANMEICKWSAVLMSLGFLIIALSPNPVLMIIGLIVYTSGTGLPSPMRSICIALIGGEHSHRIAQLFATISVVVALGNIVTGPLLPLAFHWGQKIGGMGLGLPFLCCALAMAVVAVEVFIIQLPAKETESNNDNENEESEN
jgi:MFS transporter, PCFT/HCP family, solute carrier family 46 (folate transporter), member 1